MITYPYLPPNRGFKFVPLSDPHMMAAEVARRECAGDSLYPVGVVLVRDDEVLARAGNGFNRGSGTKHICPRVVLDCPSGTGYDLCALHDSIGHAETMLMQVAHDQGIDPADCDVYMFGHWWCCEPCWKAMIDAGVRDVCVLDDAHERFSRDRVFAETLTGSRTDLRLEQDGAMYRVFVPESVEPVFTFEADSDELALRRFENVRKQL
jgi:tRNA(Arg) A34 adenosine deaminase TadA